jgi:arylsulfatase A-like enzyme/PKD repeat protein
MNNYLSKLSFGILFCAISFSSSLQAQTPDQPNVLFIMMDDLNDYVGFLGGHPQTETPNLDELARKGFIFENAYTSSPICAPSRTSIMTGKDGNYTNIQFNNEFSKELIFRDHFTAADNNEEIFTFPEVLKDSAGYFTANFHKIFHGWSDVGFDNDYDFATPDPCAKTKSWSLFTDLNGKEDLKPLAAFGEFAEGVPNLAHARLDDSREPDLFDVRMVDSAIAFIDAYAANPGDYCNRPFMAGVGIYKPHIVWHTPERYYPDYYNRDFDQFPYEIPYNEPNDLYPPLGQIHEGLPEIEFSDFDYLSDQAKSLASGDIDNYATLTMFAEMLDPLPDILPGLDSAQRKAIITEAMRSMATTAYLASIKFADEQLGRVIDALNAHPELAENTVIVFVSDHGYSMGEHRHYHKGGLWETDIRVPLLVYDPRSTTPPSRIKSEVSTLDIFPTILELTGTEIPTFSDGSPYQDGESLVQYMQNPGFSKHRPIMTIYKTLNPDRSYNCYSHYSIRDRRFHYMRYSSDGSLGDCLADSAIRAEELYEIGENREIDPNEWNDLSGDPAYRDLMDYLQQYFPDGPFYKGAPGYIEINFDELACNLTDADTLNLSVDLFTNKDESITLQPSKWDLDWTIYPSGATYSGPSISVPIASLGGASSDQLKVSVRGEYNGDTSFFVLDQRSFYYGSSADFDAQIDFTTSLDANAVSMADYEQPVDYVSGSWDFGDGFVSDLPQAPSHTYSGPGTYSITRTVNYGKDGSCVATYNSDVTLTAADFDTLICYRPMAVRIDGVSSAQAEISWDQGFGVDSFSFRFRDRETGLFAAWTNRQTTLTNAMLDNLEPRHEYEVEVSSICGAMQSDYSWVARFTTTPCDAPKNFEVLVDSIGAKIRWEPFNGAISNQLMALKPAGLPVMEQLVSATTDRAKIPGLTPATDYTFKGSSVCPQLDGSDAAGPESVTLAFTTLSSSPRLGIQIDVWPNPAGDQIQMNIPAAGQVRLVDMMGRTQLIRGDLEAGLISLDISDLPRGSYFAIWEGENAIGQSLISVQ